MSSKISVIIPIFNSIDVDKTIELLSFYENCEFILVDASNDQSGSIILDYLISWISINSSIKYHKRDLMLDKAEELGVHLASGKPVFILCYKF